jgi:signal transduction histidine kinase
MKPQTTLFLMPGNPLSAMTKSELIQLLQALPCAPTNRLEYCPAKRLESELGTYQSELELQNQELRESQHRIEEALVRYSDLYDFAPVGYLSLDKQGVIHEINLTGASMLGKERKYLLGRPLMTMLERESHATFMQHLNRVYADNGQAVDEVLLLSQGHAPQHVSIVSIVSSAMATASTENRLCRSALVDITQLKLKEAELTQSHQKLRNLSAHLDQVRESERRHLAREIHDELGQKLTSLRFQVAMLSAGINSPQTDLSQSANSLLRQIDETIESVRAIASDLRPAVLDLGLTAAVEWQLQEFRRRTGIACKLKLSNEDIPLDNDRATAVFRIIQESLTNVIRHAKASEITLKLEKKDDVLKIRITDNGIGIAQDSMEKARAFGIAGMRERVRLLDGTLTIRSRPGHGVQIMVNIPLKDRRQQSYIRKRSDS